MLTIYCYSTIAPIPSGHRVVGSHQQTKHRKTQTNKNTKKMKNETKNEGTLLVHVVTGIRYHVPNVEKDLNIKIVEGRNV